ncbi:MAG: carbohydrate ABC transporter permease [Oscillospiraceae bacterium]
MGKKQTIVPNRAPKKKKLRVKEARINRSFGGTFGIFIFLAIISIFMILPMILAVCNAFKPIDEILIFPPTFFVRKPTIDNFIQLNRLAGSFWVPISRYIFNSVFISVVATGAHILLASMAAYPLSKHNFMGKKSLNIAIEWSLIFTTAVLAIPTYIIMATLNLINTYWAVILPTVGGTLGIYLIKQFMCQFEDSVIEAARIDGCNEYKIYWSIVMPNMKPAWITALIFAFNGIWNTNGGSFIYDESLKTIPSVMQQIAGGGVARTGATAAATFLMMLPPIILFYITQNFVVETMSSSGMK